MNEVRTPQTGDPAPCNLLRRMSPEMALTGHIEASSRMSALRGRADVASASFSLLTSREMRLAASCLFDGERPIASNKNLLDQFLDALRSTQSRIAIKRLIHSYCVHFDPKHAGIVRISTFLRESINSTQSSSEWPERHRHYMIFDPSEAPKQLARLTTQSANPRDALTKAGLKGQLLASGLSVHTFLSAMDATQKQLEKEPTLEHIEKAIAWVHSDDGQTYFYAQRSALANAVLLPWTREDPSEGIRQRIQNYLLETLGDPRIDRGAWVGTQDAAREVLIRWLAQATLEQFLKVVDRVAPPHQWDYRRAFWNAYIEKRTVRNAWVAFGSSGVQVANQIATRSADNLMRRFGRLTGAASDQAVLLLSIGDLVIADWSHNGRLRIWRRGNRRAPEFNLDAYAATSLRADSDFDTVHLPPDGWQSTTEAYIRRHTDIRLSEVEYMPRRKPR